MKISTFRKFKTVAKYQIIYRIVVTVIKITGRITTIIIILIAFRIFFAVHCVAGLFGNTSELLIHFTHSIKAFTIFGSSIHIVPSKVHKIFFDILLIFPI